MKKIIIILIPTILLTIVLLAIVSMLYGNDTIWIANYMPNPMQTTLDTPFWIVRIARLITDMYLISLVTLIPSIIYAIILIKKDILTKNVKDKIIIVIMILAPIIIAGTKLFLQYGYTC